MKSTTTIGLIALLVLVAFALSGCVQNAATNDVGNPGTEEVMHSAPTSDQVATELSGGTGTSSDDISNEDLDALQTDLDALDSDVDASSQSDI